MLSLGCGSKLYFTVSSFRRTSLRFPSRCTFQLHSFQFSSVCTQTSSFTRVYCTFHSFLRLPASRGHQTLELAQLSRHQPNLHVVGFFDRPLLRSRRPCKAKVKAEPSTTASVYLLLAVLSPAHPLVSVPTLTAAWFSGLVILLEERCSLSLQR